MANKIKTKARPASKRPIKWWVKILPLLSVAVLVALVAVIAIMVAPHDNQSDESKKDPLPYPKQQASFNDQDEGEYHIMVAFWGSVRGGQDYHHPMVDWLCPRGCTIHTSSDDLLIPYLLNAEQSYDHDGKKLPVEITFRGQLPENGGIYTLQHGSFGSMKYKLVSSDRYFDRTHVWDIYEYPGNTVENGYILIPDYYSSNERANQIDYEVDFIQIGNNFYRPTQLDDGSTLYRSNKPDEELTVWGS